MTAPPQKENKTRAGVVGGSGNTGACCESLIAGYFIHQGNALTESRARQERESILFLQSSSGSQLVLPALKL